MPLTRRALVRLAVAAPVGLALTRAVEGAGAVLAGAAAGLRPPASGTSSTRCAACGAPDHTMLDPRCPAARRVV